MVIHAGVGTEVPARDDDKLWLRVGDIKQYLYCPRIPFYEYVCPVARPTTFKMEYGRRQHDVIEKLEQRRTLRRYGLEWGRRLFHQLLVSETLRLSGRLDLLVELGPTEYLPVEFKYTLGHARLTHKYQLAAYALLVESLKGCQVQRGMVYLVPQEEIVEIALTENVKQYTRHLMARLRRMIKSQQFPAPTRRVGRCVDCEYRRHCADVEPEGP